jgi:glycosyltransferase involved in cell wall biosynthesis
MSEKPLVTIIISLFNREKLIGATLRSLMDQRYPHWEALVMDDHSADNGPAVVKALAEEDPRIRYVANDQDYDLGCTGSRNLGFSQSKGEWILFLDDDDLLVPEALDYMLKGRKDSTRAIVCPGRFFTMEGGEIKKLGTFHKRQVSSDIPEGLILKKTGWPVCGVLWHKDSLPQKPFSEEDFSREWIFHCLMALRLKPEQFEFLPGENCLIRTGHNNQTARRSNKAHFEYVNSRVYLLKAIFNEFPNQKKYHDVALKATWRAFAMGFKKGLPKLDTHFVELLEYLQVPPLSQFKMRLTARGLPFFKPALRLFMGLRPKINQA